MFVLMETFGQRQGPAEAGSRGRVKPALCTITWGPMSCCTPGAMVFSSYASFTTHGLPQRRLSRDHARQRPRGHLGYVHYGIPDCQMHPDQETDDRSWTFRPCYASVCAQQGHEILRVGLIEHEAQVALAARLGHLRHPLACGMAREACQLHTARYFSLLRNQALTGSSYNFRLA
jgi:hypothetical protein